MWSNKKEAIDDFYGIKYAFYTSVQFFNEEFNKVLEDNNFDDIEKFRINKNISLLNMNIKSLSNKLKEHEEDFNCSFVKSDDYIKVTKPKAEHFVNTVVKLTNVETLTKPWSEKLFIKKEKN